MPHIELRHVTLISTALVGITLLASACTSSSGDKALGGTSPMHDETSNSSPSPARSSDADWATFRGDVHRTGYHGAPPRLSSMKPLWRFNTGGRVESSPTVWGGKIFVGSFWTFAPSTEPIFASPAVAGGVVYIGSYDDHVYALDAEDGTELWRHRTGGDVFSSPAVVLGRVYIGAGDGFHVLDAATGEELWKKVDGGAVYASAAVVAGSETVYIGTSESGVFLYSFSGEMLQDIEIDDRVWSSISVDALGNIYFGAHTGHVYAWGHDSSSAASSL